MATFTTDKVGPAGVATKRRGNSRVRGVAIGVAVLALVLAMAMSTKVVTIGSSADTRPQSFPAADYGAATFPSVQTAVAQRAVDAVALAAQYGVPAGIGPEISVKFTGVVGKGTSGVYYVTVDGVPSSVLIRVQTGPAINGTDLRDATGKITFGQFTNQIEYQNAGSAINNEMKKQVLSKIDNTNLTGKTISVVGAFKLINPNGWLVTPVTLSVQ
jgi:predicted lipoprotein